MITKTIQLDLKLPTEPTKSKSTFKGCLCLFYGAPGVGKTTFVNNLTAKKVLFISTDRGTRYLETMRVECNSWKKLQQILTALKKDHKTYDFICLDHVDDICNLAESNVCEEMNIEALGDADWGKGWKLYESKIRKLVQDLLSLSLGVVFISHEVTRTNRSRTLELEVTMPALSKAAGKVIIPMCEIVGYISVRVMRNAEKQKVNRHVLQTQPKEELYCKDRTDRRKNSKDYELLNAEEFLKTFEV